MDGPNVGTLCKMRCDYDGYGEDELTLRRGDIVEVLSKDSKISGNEGWWTGKIGNRVGIFPAYFFADDGDLDLSEIAPTEIEPAQLRYEDLIGTGGYGRVYRGIWGDEEVAIKEVHQGPGGPDDKARRDLVQEAQFLCLFNHENIVSLMGVCVTPPKLSLVMEYARGGPLNRALSSRKIQPEVLANWAIQIARGMEYLHYYAPVSIIHRDLKSCNILIVEPIDGDDLLLKTIKITDFGLAREAYNTTRMSESGTYAWMAPEVIREQTFSKASDVWSFGVVLWELLTGEIPYKNMERLAIVLGVGRNKINLHIPATFPQSWRDLMIACWARDSHMRPNFKDIRRRLGGPENSEFASTPCASFNTMQKNWKREVERDLHLLKNKQKEIMLKEEDLLSKERRMELELREKMEALVQREMELMELVSRMRKQLRNPPPRMPQFGRFNSFLEPPLQ